MGAGAAILILLKKYLDDVVIYPTNISIVSINGQMIECSGQATLNLVMKNLRAHQMFVITDTTKPLLGYNFLSHFSLMVDCTNNKIHGPNN